MYAACWPKWAKNEICWKLIIQSKSRSLTLFLPFNRFRLAINSISSERYWAFLPNENRSNSHFMHHPIRFRSTYFNTIHPAIWISWRESIVVPFIFFSHLHNSYIILFFLFHFKMCSGFSIFIICSSILFREREYQSITAHISKFSYNCLFTDTIFHMNSNIE